MNRLLNIFLIIAMIAVFSKCELFEEEKPCGDKTSSGPQYVYGITAPKTIQYFNVWEGKIIYRFYYPQYISDIKMCPKEHIKVYNAVELNLDFNELLPNAEIGGKVTIGNTGSFIFFRSYEYSDRFVFSPENSEDIGLQQVYGDQPYGWISGYIDITFDYSGSIEASDQAIFNALRTIWMEVNYYKPKG